VWAESATSRQLSNVLQHSWAARDICESIHVLHYDVPSNKGCSSATAAWGTVIQMKAVGAQQ